MATTQSTMDYLLDQLSSVGKIRAHKMFGEYALYCEEKVVGLVCNNELFVKITEQGKAFVGDAYQEGFAYPGARASMYISGDMFDDRNFLCELITITTKALPPPKIKKPKKKKA